MVMITWYRELSSVDFSATNYSDFCPKCSGRRMCQRLMLAIKLFVLISRSIYNAYVEAEKSLNRLLFALS